MRKNNCLEIFKKSFGFPSFSPFDLVIFFRIITFLLVWKTLSLDYSSLSLLKNESGLFFQFSENFIVVVQFLSAFFFIHSFFYINRYSSLLGLVLIYVLEWKAFSLRGMMYDLDTPASTLLILLIFPYRWRDLFNKNINPNSQATNVGISLSLYIGLAYLVAGLSKFKVDDWSNNIKLENLYFCMRTWHQATLPDWLDSTAYTLSNIFSYSPLLAKFSAIFALIVETLWISFLFLNKRVRLLFPICMFVIHLIIFLASGIFFLNFAVTCFAITIPWRSLKNREEISSSFKMTKRTYFAFIFPLLFALAPVGMMRHLPPFPNFNSFGWDYGSCKENHTVYRYGYLDSSGSYRMIPLDYYGFFDFTGILVSGAYIEEFIKNPSDENFLKVKKFANSIRGYDSNKWILSSLAMPNHLVSGGKTSTEISLSKIFLVKGEFSYVNKRIEEKWTRASSVSIALDKKHVSL